MQCPQQIYDFWKQNVESSAWFDSEKECLVVFFVNARK